MAETYVLDTNIFVGYVRDASYARYVDAEYGPRKRDNIALISVVSRGELLSLAYQFGWGEKKRKHLHRLLHSVVVAPIDVPALVDRYAEIDAYSKGKLPERPLPEGESAYTLGKNDLWIAATASIMECPLISTDADFQMLHGVYIELIYVAQDADYSDFE